MTKTTKSFSFRERETWKMVCSAGWYVCVDKPRRRKLAVITTFCRYTIHEEPERTWGRDKDGVFGGMMGQLQREESDMCTNSGPSPSRLKVIDFVRISPSDIMTVTSLQPSLLPQYLALVRPFSGKCVQSQKRKSIFYKN